MCNERNAKAQVARFVFVAQLFFSSFFFFSFFSGVPFTTSPTGVVFGHRNMLLRVSLEPGGWKPGGLDLGFGAGHQLPSTWFGGLVARWLGGLVVKGGPTNPLQEEPGGGGGFRPLADLRWGTGSPPARA